MKLSVTFLLITITCCCFGQSPTFQALLKLNHNVNNNAYDLRKESNGKTERYWVNVFFNYYKNLNTRGSQKSDEDMIFSIGYEYLIKKRFDESSNLKFLFPTGSTKDKVKVTKISILNESKETKVKKKYIKTTRLEGVIEISINKEGLPKHGLIHIYSEIESFNFKNLRVAANFGENIESFLSYNVPEMFKYSIPEIELEELDKQTGIFNLKHFTYQSTPIVNYNVTTNSFKWRIKSNSSTNIFFKLISIELPVNMGTSHDQIMKHSN